MRSVPIALDRHVATRTAPKSIPAALRTAGFIRETQNGVIVHGWAEVNAVKEQRLYEIKSADILQPGPAALTDGVEQLHRIVMDWAKDHG